jgi:hypothetical protein
MMLVEIVFLILIIGIIYSVAIPKSNTKLHYGVDKMMLYFKYLRYIAMIDNKYDINNNEWFKTRWSIKFHTCTNEKSNQEKYFLIFQNIKYDTGNRVSRYETLKDPINNKHLYANSCTQNQKLDSNYIFLTSQFGIKNIKASCNSGGAIQIVFAKDGRIFERIGSREYDDEITKQCTIKFTDKNNKKAVLLLEPKTGYIYKQSISK